MKKDTFYFSHDANAKDDPKCMMLIDQLGLEGYGIYWVLIETLRNQPDYKCPVAMIPALARRYNTSAEKMNVVVKNFNLFDFEKPDAENSEIFFSPAFLTRMQIMDDKRKALRMAALKGNAIRWGSQGESGGDRRAIAIKGKEIKEKEKESILLESDPAKIFYKIEDCIRIALSDNRWTKAIKTNENELFLFNQYLEKTGRYEFNPADYKKYFSVIKGKYPNLLKQEFTVAELRLMALEIDKNVKNQ